MTAESRELIEQCPPSPESPPSVSWSSLVEMARARTPARIMMGRAGAAYKTDTWLKLRVDHAFAKDAVLAEVDLPRDFGEAFVTEWGLFDVATMAATKNDYLLRPDLGRSLSASARAELRKRCPPSVDLQVAIAGGLSAMAVQTQVPALLPLLKAQAAHRGWRFGQPFLVRHARVGGAQTTWAKRSIQQSASSCSSANAPDSRPQKAFQPTWHSGRELAMTTRNET